MQRSGWIISWLNDVKYKQNFYLRVQRQVPMNMRKTSTGRGSLISCCNRCPSVLILICLKANNQNTHENGKRANNYKWWLIRTTNDIHKDCNWLTPLADSCVSWIDWIACTVNIITVSRNRNHSLFCSTFVWKINETMLQWKCILWYSSVLTDDWIVSIEKRTKNTKQLKMLLFPYAFFHFLEFFLELNRDFHVSKSIVTKFHFEYDNRIKEPRQLISHPCV